MGKNTMMTLLGGVLLGVAAYALWQGRRVGAAGGLVAPVAPPRAVPQPAPWQPAPQPGGGGGGGGAPGHMPEHLLVAGTGVEFPGWAAPDGALV